MHQEDQHDDAGTSDVDKQSQMSATDPQSDKQEPASESLSFFTVARDPHIIFALGVGFLNSFTWSELEPVLALRLKEDFQLTQFQIGLFLTLMTGGEFFGGVCIQFHAKHIEPKVFLIGSCLVIACGYFLNGPCEVLPDSIVLMAIGNFISGFAMCYQSVYSITELTTRAKLIYPHRTDDISDYCAAILNTFIGLGQALGPVYGANMVASLGFRVAQDGVCITCLAFSVLYFIVCDGPTAFKSLKPPRENALQGRRRLRTSSTNRSVSARCDTNDDELLPSKDKRQSSKKR